MRETDSADSPRTLREPQRVTGLGLEVLPDRFGGGAEIALVDDVVPREHGWCLVVLREDRSVATERVSPLDFVQLAESAPGDDGLTRLERELIACHAGHVAEERWYTEELQLVSSLPTAARHQSAGDAEAVRFLLSRYPSRRTPSIRRETRLMAYALLDEHWPAVRRLVEAFCRRPLPVRLSGRAAERIMRFFGLGRLSSRLG